ncbi:MAG: hypothetical protein L3J74_00865 [Bacteroidales bacterium]|nr:hypothetical protein [Bacteroidales bacterium]
MSIIDFIRLLVKNSFVLIVVPIIMAVTVFILTENEEERYYSNTVIYTGIASGYSIESQSNSRIDFFAVNNAFDNFINIIKSRSNLTEVALKLFAQNMILKSPNPQYISEKNYYELHNSVPEDVKSLIDTNSIEISLLRLYEYLNRNDTNYLYRLLNNEEDEHYSIEAISKIAIKRYQNSDLLEISYECDDPGICQQTLIILEDAIVKNYTKIKQNQTADVVRYFEKQLAVSEKRLKNAEDELLKFNRKNNIINYYEQTKYIASQKENLDLEYQREQMKLYAAEAVIKNLESKLNSNQHLKLYSDNIMKKRDELSKITSKITLLETASVNDTLSNDVNKQLLALRVSAEKLKGELTQAVNSLYLSENSIAGLPSEKILEDWLKNVISYEESKARIVILNKRRNEFKKIYEIFAPLGATIKRLEREISIAEREYLSLLHSLSLAKLKQQNLELSSNIKIIDKPFYPIEPLPSKRKFLVAIGGIAGFVIVLFLIIALEYLDVNIKTPYNIEKLTNLKVVGVYPLIVKNKKTAHIDYNFIVNRTTELLVQNIRQKQFNKEKKPYKVLFFSTRNFDGKTMLASRIVQMLRELNYKVLLLTSVTKSNEKFYQEVDSDAFANDKSLMNIKSVEDMVLFNDFCNPNDYDYVFVVIPGINKSPYPIELLATMDDAYMVCRANRPWSEADTASLKRIQKAINHLSPEIILNGVELPVIEQIIGELPKRRSKLRVMIKRILKRQFYYVKKIESEEY